MNVIIGGAMTTMLTTTVANITPTNNTICLVGVADKLDCIDWDVPIFTLIRNDIDIFYFDGMIQTKIIQCSIQVQSQIEFTDTFNPSCPIRGTP